MFRLRLLMETGRVWMGLHALDQCRLLGLPDAAVLRQPEKGHYEASEVTVSEAFARAHFRPNVVVEQEVVPHNMLMKSDVRVEDTRLLWSREIDDDRAIDLWVAARVDRIRRHMEEAKQKCEELDARLESIGGGSAPAGDLLEAYDRVAQTARLLLEAQMADRADLCWQLEQNLKALEQVTKL